MIEHLTDADYEVASFNGIKKDTAYSRVYVYGWDVKRAITQPVTPTSEWARIAESNGIHRSTFHSRVNSGWDIEEAATKKARTRKVVREGD